MLFIKALWDKVQNYVIISAFVYGGIVTTLYYHSSTDLKEATSAAQKATAALQVCVESKDRLRDSQEIDSSISTEQSERLRELEEEKDSLLEQLANIPRKDCKTKEPSAQEGANEEVDIDGTLPADLRRLLQQSHNRTERSANTSSQ